VSASKGHAEADQLPILASGPSAAEEIARRAFSAIGRKTVWLGEAGQGSRMKLVVNAYMSILSAARLALGKVARQPRRAGEPAR
jgi:3-hydroxyisobutyrate dehydrogenase